MSTADTTGESRATVAPSPATVILHNPPLRPGADRSRLSVLSDTRWDL